MSDALGTQLRIVLSVPKGARNPASTDAAKHVTATVRARPPRFGHQLEIVRGPIAEIGYEIARTKAAAMVVVTAQFNNRAARKLVDRLDVPILLARDAHPDGDWIAASDMQHREFPVLSKARRLARALDHELVCFHNARPAPVFVRDPMGAADYVSMLKRQDDVAEVKRARLAHLTAADRHVHSVVTSSTSTLAVLLELARRRDADMIVVGHSSRSWMRRMARRGTTDSLIENCRRSVLIVPVAAPARSRVLPTAS